MLRARRRPWWIMVFVIGVGASWLLISPLAQAVETPTTAVTFTSNGAPPFACGTRPDVSSVTMSEGGAVVIANRTGVSVDVVVGGQTRLTIADDEGASLTLAPGQHQIRLVPECAVVTQTRVLTVTVTSAPAPTSDPPATLDGPTTSEAPDSPDAPAVPAAPPPAEPAGTPDPPARTDPPTQPGPAPGAAPPATGPRAAPEDPNATPGAPPSSGAGAVDANLTPTPWAVQPIDEFGAVQEADVLRVDPVALPGASHPKGLRLLAVVATICVLGVTVAIIRTIVRLSP